MFEKIDNELFAELNETKSQFISGGKCTEWVLVPGKALPRCRTRIRGKTKTVRFMGRGTKPYNP